MMMVIPEFVTYVVLIIQNEQYRLYLDKAVNAAIEYIKKERWNRVEWTKQAQIQEYIMNDKEFNKIVNDTSKNDNSNSLD